jgi:hypothetical protein
MSHPQVVRGRPLRTLLILGSVLGVGLSLVAVWIWSGDEPASRKLAAVLLLATLGIMLTLALAIAAALTTARVDGGILRFAFCGIAVRTIPLNTIRGYERLFGRGSSVRILYGSTWYCPNGLLDSDQMVDLLRSHGVPETNAN